jgi:hypothetical protein
LSALLFDNGLPNLPVLLIEHYEMISCVTA